MRLHSKRLAVMTAVFALAGGGGVAYGECTGMGNPGGNQGGPPGTTTPPTNTTTAPTNVTTASTATTAGSGSSNARHHSRRHSRRT